MRIYKRVFTRSADEYSDVNIIPFHGKISNIGSFYFSICVTAANHTDIVKDGKDALLQAQADVGVLKPGPQLDIPDLGIEFDSLSSVWGALGQKLGAILRVSEQIAEVCGFCLYCYFEY